MTASTGYERDNTGAFIRKDPESVLDYTINWSDFLTTGDTISSATYTVDTGLTKDSNSNTTTTTTVTLSGGTAGTVGTDGQSDSQAGLAPTPPPPRGNMRWDATPAPAALAPPPAFPKP